MDLINVIVYFNMFFLVLLTGTQSKINNKHLVALIKRLFRSEIHKASGGITGSESPYLPVLEY